ncbi:MAG: Nramp family divalent metal transporter [Bryobacterales bacterium]|nr:Nramp family divalent metal transporter [Bryobacterales bacterium]
MALEGSRDPYQLDPAHVAAAPGTLRGILRFLGPGLILASSIVGSGELIATTVLGAENGYVLLWLIILSCLVKTVVQNELGRYAIATGRTTLEAFDDVPGPRFKVSWLAWMWCAMVTFTLFQVGAMLGGIAEILNRAVPGVPIAAFVWALAALSVVLLIAGKYVIVERVALGLVISFTALTFSCCFLLFKLPQYFDWGAVARGLAFQPPAGGMATAVAAFGITGVGATELVMYPYWCIEKGYAQYAGKRDDSRGWAQRALGWSRVMGFDVIFSMVIYTFATVAFYLLGAGVLKGMGLTPQGPEMVQVLSAIYTQTLGDWSLGLFMVGAFAVLYSTVFASTAAHCRVWADFVGMLGVYDKSDYRKRLQVIRVFVVLLLVVPCLYFMWIREPVLMVKIGGIAQAIMLPVIGGFAIFLRYRRMPGSVLPKAWVTLMLWVSAALMALFMGYSAIDRLV